MRVLSKQQNVPFVFCPDPITIDKRKAWGDGSDNLQHATNGAFLKMKSATEISHLVQPNADNSAPIGWVPGSVPGLFDKSPIHIIRRVEAGTNVELQTADGKINYEVKEPSAVVCNDINGQPNESDSWVQVWREVEKNYHV